MKPLLEFINKAQESNSPCYNELMLEFIKSKNLAELTRFYLNQPQASKYLANSFFNEFWQTRLSLFEPSSATTFQFQRQKSFKPREFLLGYGCWALDDKENSDTDRLLRGLELASFHCLKAIIVTKLVDIEKDASFRLHLQEVLFSNKVIATKHKTPGFLLYAMTYLQLASSESNDVMIAKACLIQMFQNLYLAKAFEASSQIEIHNAYFGQGIICSNPFGLTNCDEIITQAKTMLSNLVKENMLTFEEYEYILNGAQLASNKQLQQLQSPESKGLSFIGLFSPSSEQKEGEEIEYQGHLEAVGLVSTPHRGSV